MNKGWRYESNRHALAARGIKSGQNKIDDTGCPHSPKDLYSWKAYDGTQVVVCKKCHNILRGAAPTREEEDARYLRELKSRGEPIVLGIKGHGSIDGDIKVSLEGADELIPLLKSRGITQQAVSAFISDAGSQHIQGKYKNVDVDVTVTHPGPNQYRIAGKINGNPVDRTVTKDQIRQVWNKIKGELM